jgi:hypothetical protein
VSQSPDAGLLFYSAVNFGVGPNCANLYVVGLDGSISAPADPRP